MLLALELSLCQIFFSTSINTILQKILYCFVKLLQVNRVK